MAAFTNVVRWEGFKLRHRRMPWILLAVFLAFTQLAVWGSYFSYSAAAMSGGFVPIPMGAATRGMPRMIRCNDLRSKPSDVLPSSVPPQAAAMLLSQCERQLATRYQATQPIASTSSALAVASTVGMVLLAILSASAFGAEFGLGTLRPILVRGVGRVSYLGGKFLVLALAATGALVLATVAAALSGLLISKMVVPPTNAITVAGSWSDVMITCVRVWASMLAFLTMASSITVLTRSTAAGMAVSLGWYIFEGIFIRLMSAAFSWFETVGEYLPMRNLGTLGKSIFSLAPAAVGGSTIGMTQASIVVAAYVVVFAGVAVTVFRSRDVGGVSGT